MVSSLAAHHFGLVRVFIGAALICLFVAACWFLWIHLKSPCQSSRRKNFSTADAPSQFPKGIFQSHILFLIWSSSIRHANSSSPILLSNLRHRPTKNNEPSEFVHSIVLFKTIPSSNFLYQLIDK